jgi:hypothetical protein
MHRLTAGVAACVDLRMEADLAWLDVDQRRRIRRVGQEDEELDDRAREVGANSEAPRAGPAAATAVAAVAARSWASS